MKNAFFSILFCACAAVLNAQETLSIGPVVGINFSKITDVRNAEFNPGFTGGAQLTYSDINNWGVCAAMLYSQEGVDVGSSGTELTYLRIPLKGYWFFRDNEDVFRPKIFAGLSLGLLLDSDVKYGNTEVDVQNSYNGFDLGVSVGAGFNARIATGTWFNFDAGYTHGLLDVADNFNGKNRNIGVTAGVLFGF